MEQTKQENTGGTAETKALHDEELKDASGGGRGYPGTEYTFKCPACGVTFPKADFGNMMGYEACLKLAQSIHRGCGVEIECIKKGPIK